MLTVSLFMDSPVPFVSEADAISFRESDTILDLLQRLITTSWVHPDKALIVITNVAQFQIKPLEDAFSFTNINSLPLSQLGSDLAIVEMSHKVIGHIAHAKTADTISHKTVQDTTSHLDDPTPYFSFAESIIIPIIECRSCSFTALAEAQLDDLLISLISRCFSPFTHDRDP